MNVFHAILFFLACLATGISEARAGDTPLRMDCKQIFAFSNGEFDNADTVFGKPITDWDVLNLSTIRSGIRSCFGKLETEMVRRGSLSDEQREFMAGKAKIADKKATAIVEKNRSNAYATELDQKRRARDEAEQLAKKDADEKSVLDAKIDACENSSNYKLYRAQEEVIGNSENLAAWREKQKHEARVAQVSGVRNLLAERTAGEWIVQLTDDLNSSFSEYRQLGGKAKSPSGVKRTIANNCEGLRR